ncbi:uncharacterized protein LOC117124944 [Anneissia japonica]|uniref:uncharacterized protein LOC117124944 n=1 Tax=Anneissia japonica TaxID=1529436 RepID=UPI0014259740|nr:uncharacterized protein LOC117124944 [Anneissia japonica]XP_033127177.1 uncharacterized protein LOC117124944 [Anneissia japonica]
MITITQVILRCNHLLNHWTNSHLTTSEEEEGESAKDYNYQPESEFSSEDSDEEYIQNKPTNNIAKDKVIVFESSLDNLLMRTLCGECQCCVDSMHKFIQGTALKVKLQCINGHEWTWSSQPMIGSMTAGNLLSAASILLSGDTLTAIHNLCRTLNLQMIGRSPSINCKIVTCFL